MSRSKITRRKIDEVLFEYNSNGTKGIVYVEGSNDKRILDFFVFIHDLNCRVFSIEDFEIDEYTLLKYGLSDNSNKHKIVALANRLAEEIDDISDRAIFIVDTDLDYYFEPIDMGNTKNTVYNNFISYIDIPDLLRKFGHFVLRERYGDGISFSAKMLELLRIHTAARLFNILNMSKKSTGYPCEYINLKRGEDIDININHYVSQLRLAVEGSISAEESKLALNSMIGYVGHDPRRYVNDHDLIETIKYIFNYKNSLSFRGEDTLDRLIFLSYDFKKLKHSRIFNEVVQFANKQ